MSTTINISNGIDVGQLGDTIDAIRTDPDLGAFTFRARSTWQGGTHSLGEIGAFTHAGEEDRTRVAPFRLEGDEPPALLGKNNGPNAAARGIEITRMVYEIEGDLDVGPFLGLDGARPGFTAIRAKGTVSSPNATPEQLQELCQYVQDTSPVRDCLVDPVPVQTTLEIG